MRKRYKTSQTQTLTPEPQPKPSKNSTLTRTKSEQEKALAKFPTGILINVTAAGVVNYPEGCDGLYPALSAFESRRANVRDQRIQAERAEQYELAQGTQSRAYPDNFLDTCVRVFRPDAKGKEQLIRTEQFSGISGKPSLKGKVPTPEQLRDYWEEGGQTVNKVAKAFGVGWPKAQSWLMQAGIIPSKKYGEAK